MIVHVPLDRTVKGSPLSRPARWHRNEAFEIVDAREHARARRQARLPRERRPQGADGRARRHERRKFFGPAPAQREFRETPPRRLPEIRVAAERGHFGRCRASQAPRDVLRPEKRRAGCGERLRKARFEEEELAAEIEAEGQERRERLRKRRALGPISLRDRVELGLLVVEDRQREAIALDEGRGGAVADGHDRTDALLQRAALQRIEQERLDRGRIEGAVGRVGKRCVGARGGVALRAGLGIGDDDLGIALADVEHRDEIVCHRGLNRDETSAGGAA